VTPPTREELEKAFKEWKEKESNYEESNVPNEENSNPEIQSPVQLAHSVMMEVNSENSDLPPIQSPSIFPKVEEGSYPPFP